MLGALEEVIWGGRLVAVGRGVAVDSGAFKNDWTTEILKPSPVVSGETYAQAGTEVAGGIDNIHLKESF